MMHRDLKPSNLFFKLTPEETTVRLKLADFGQARVLQEPSANVQYSLEVGTKWYKAPEILYGQRSYTESVDMWSFGVILAELLDHTPLFTGANDLD